MEIATVTSKGQITIPVSIRKLLKIDKGDKIIMEEQNGTVVMINASRHLDLSKLCFSNEHPSTDDSLLDDEPFEWDDEIFNGNRKVKI